jgi:hypothetical protein
MAIAYDIFSIAYLWFLSSFIIPSSQWNISRVPTPEQRADTISMKHEMVDLKCLEFDEGTYIVNSVDELMKANNGKVRQKLQTCVGFKLPDIDFKKYTLVGIHTNVIGCKKPNRTLKVFRLKGKNKTFIHDIFGLEGYCRKAHHFSDWFLIEKVQQTANVSISIKTSG